MHELALTRSIVAIVAEHACGAPVLRVKLEIGKLSAVMPEAIRFCFDVASRGTLLEGAALEIVEPPARARCRACAAELELDQPYGRCACGSGDLQWIGGTELSITEMEISECAQPVVAPATAP